MRTTAHRTIVVATGAITLAAAAGAVAATRDHHQRVAPAQRPAILKVDIDQLGRGLIRLQATTSGATRVTFTQPSRDYRGHLTDIDFEDGTREWSHIVASRPATARVITMRVQACHGGACTSRIAREVVEPDDFDRDDDH